MSIINNMVRCAELSRISLGAKYGKKILESVAKTLAMVISEFVNNLEESAKGFQVAVGQISILEDVAEKQRNARIFRHPSDTFIMVKRRMKQAGLPEMLSPHSFRVTTATDFLNQGIPLDEVQYLLGHSDPRTTRLYDRREKRVTRNIVERISI